MKIRILFFGALTATFLSLMAQLSSSGLHEKIDLRTNYELYLTGESVYFQLSCTIDESPSQLSKIVYLELMDESGVSRIQLIRDLNEGELVGSFFLPSSLITGNYVMVAYTNWMKNNPSTIYTKCLSIINPFEPIPEEVFAEIIPNSGIESSDEVTTIPNEMVNLDSSIISITLNEDHVKPFFITVQKFDERSRYSAPSITKLAFADPESTTRKIYLPELHGHILSGQIRDKAGNSLEASISISNQSTSQFPVFTKSAKDGFFKFVLSQRQRTGKLILKSNPTTEIELSNPFLTAIDQLDLPELTIPSDFKSWILKRAQQIQIEDNYFTLKYAPKEINMESLDFIDSKTYVIDDYKRFPSIEDPIIEYIPEVSFRIQDGYKRFIVPEYLYQAQSDSILVLLDHIPVTFKTIFNQNAAYIEKVTVYPKLVSINNFEFAEVIHFETFDRFDKILSNVQILDYSIQNYQLDGHNESPIPDYRDQLYWGIVDPMKEGNSKIHFRKTMSSGVYLIEIFDTRGNALKKGRLNIK